MKADELWVPMLGELTWMPFEPGKFTARPAAEAGTEPKTIAEYNAARLCECMESLTETFVELYLEANPQMAQRHGHA